MLQLNERESASNEIQVSKSGWMESAFEADMAWQQRVGVAVDDACQSAAAGLAAAWQSECLHSATHDSRARGAPQHRAHPRPAWSATCSKFVYVGSHHPHMANLAARARRHSWTLATRSWQTWQPILTCSGRII